MLEAVVLDTKDDVAEHLDEAPEGVPHKARVARAGDHRLDGFGREAQIEDGIHHAGHRGRGTRAYRDQQRIGAVAEGLAGGRLETRDGGIKLGAQQLVQFALADLVELGAGLGGDGETWRHRQADARHIGQVGTLAAQQRTHAALPLGLAVTKEIDVLRHVLLDSAFPQPHVACAATCKLPRQVSHKHPPIRQSHERKHE